MGKAELERALSTLDVWLIIFGIFVAIGVVGESIVGYLHWRKSGQLSTLQTSENLTLQQSIAEARARAAEANQRSEEEKTARIKLAEEYGARHLTDETVRVLVKSLKGKVRKLTVIRIREIESSILGMELVLAFRTAGIDTSERTILRLSDGSDLFPSGIRVMYDQNAQGQKEEAEALTATLNSVNIGLVFMGIGAPTSFPEGTPFPSVYVGLKWPVAGGPEGPRSRFLSAPPSDLWLPNATNNNNDNPKRE
jgi:hypothetical protein